MSFQTMVLNYLEEMVNLENFAYIKTDQPDALKLLETIGTSNGWVNASLPMLLLNIKLGNDNGIA